MPKWLVGKWTVLVLSILCVFFASGWIYTAATAPKRDYNFGLDTEYDLRYAILYLETPPVNGKTQAQGRIIAASLLGRSGGNLMQAGADLSDYNIQRLGYVLQTLGSDISDSSTIPVVLSTLKGMYAKLPKLTNVNEVTFQTNPKMFADYAKSVVKALPSYSSEGLW